MFKLQQKVMDEKIIFDFSLLQHFATIGLKSSRLFVDCWLLDSIAQRQRSCYQQPWVWSSAILTKQSLNNAKKLPISFSGKWALGKKTFFPFADVGAFFQAYMEQHGGSMPSASLRAYRPDPKDQTELTF